jgi:glycosyltransferase involved in cell wall biosynthesis
MAGNAGQSVNRCLRIVQYITPSQIGGAELHVAALSERLQARGHQVLVVCPRGRPLAAELTARGLPMRTPRTAGKLDPVTLVQLVRWLRRDRADVIHTHLSTASLLGSIAARIAGVPSLATVHGLNTHTCFRFANRIIAVSHAVKRHLVAQGIPDERVMVVHNGVDLRSLARPSSRERLCREWGIAESAPLLVTVGRLVPTKGHRDLLQALRLLVQDPRWQQLRLLVVGTGVLLGQLQTEAAQAGLADRVVFAGFQRDVLPFVHAANVFVLPSTQEGLSLSALEAMALGKPVVACRVGGTPEVVADEETGLLVSPGRPEELAAALARLLGHPAEAERMGAQGERRARCMFDLEQMVSRIEAVYGELVRRPPPSGRAPRSP